jgi:hypothetical protein
MLTKPEAKSIISALDLKPIDAYVTCIQRDYANIMEPVKKPRKSRKIEPIEVQLEQPEEVAESHEVVIEKENE